MGHHDDLREPAPAFAAPDGATPRSLTALALVALLVTTIAAPVAEAQSPGGRSGSPGQGGRGPGAVVPADGPRGVAAEAPLSPGAIVQKQLDRIEDELRLTPEQKSAWGAYADNLQRLAEQVERSRFEARTAVVEPGMAGQQLERIAAAAQGRAALARAIADHGQQLYALLSSAQRRVADARLWQPLLLLTVGLAPAPPSDAVPGSR